MARPAQQDAIWRALELEGLEWLVAERNHPTQHMRLAERIADRNYGFVIYLTNLNTRNAEVVIDACKESETPFVYSVDGYGVSAVARAIQEYLHQ